MQAPDLYETLVESLPNYAVIVYDHDYRYLFANGNALKTHQMNDVVGKTLWELMTPEIRDYLEPHYKASLKGEPRAFETSYEEHTYHTRMVPLRDEKGNVYAAMAISNEITDRKALELQLRQSQKMEALGTLASGIAHDFNNILGSILGYTELLLNKQFGNGADKQYLSQVYQSGQRAAKLIDQILIFVRPGTVELEVIDFEKVLRSSVEMMRSSLPASIDMFLDIEQDCAPLLANESQLRQVVVNLITNSFQAMEAGGVLEVTLKTLKKSLELRVKDNGIGMSASSRERMFDPFYTTKPIGDGTGLGLSVVHGIIRNHHADISVVSQEGEGTTVSILFPTTDHPQIEESLKEYQPHPSETGDHIMIVDDESALVNLFEVALAEKGYEVTTFTDSTAAFKAFCKKPDTFDLIFTDQTMSKMSGIDLAKKIHAIRPDLPIVLASGNVLKISKVDQELVQHILKKPVGIDNLLEVLSIELAK